jgi:hypothetical protein
VGGESRLARDRDRLGEVGLRWRGSGAGRCSGLSVGAVERVVRPLVGARLPGTVGKRIFREAEIRWRVGGVWAGERSGGGG